MIYLTQKTPTFYLEISCPNTFLLILFLASAWGSRWDSSAIGPVHPHGKPRWHSCFWLWHGLALSLWAFGIWTRGWQMCRLAYLYLTFQILWNVLKNNKPKFSILPKKETKNISISMEKTLDKLKASSKIIKNSIYKHVKGHLARCRVM